MALMRPETPPTPPPPPAPGGGELAPPQTQRMRARQRLWARMQRLAARVDHVVDRWHGGLRRRFGHAGALAILAYRGFGNAQRVTVLGRVVEARINTLPAAADSRFRNIVRVFRHFNTREVPEAALQLRLGAASGKAITDEEGYFRATLPLGGPRAPNERRQEPRDIDGWRPVDIELHHCQLPGFQPVAARAEILVPGPDSELGIVSDIDDTVLQTHVTERLRMLWVTFAHNAHTRLPFPGTTELYRALAAGSSGRCRNPVFYVSKSPWNLYDFLVEFLDRHQLPRGPLFLRDVGTSTEGPMDHKSACIDQIFEMYPQLPFVLIGDSGERDPDIYVETAARHPGRVRAIYIREVGSSPARRRQLAALRDEAQRLGCDLLCLTHADQALQHARAHGLAC
jgi:phosphatidate phosphatase APP1